MEQLEGRVTVLYIGGEGRSGSTLLSAILGNLPGFLPVGELRGVWEALRTNELCGCGAAFFDCEFWNEVGATAFGDWAHVDLEEMLSLDSSLARHRSLIRTASPIWTRQTSLRFEAYADKTLALYRAVQEISGAEIIVDSTKEAPYATLLSRIDALDVRIVHLIRDSRGVVFSWSKTGVERPEYAMNPNLQGTFVHRRSAVSAACGWAARNSLLAALSRRRMRRMVMQYERLMTQPEEQIAGVVRFAGHTLSAERVGEHREYESLPFHTLGGNRLRFNRGRLLIRADEEWRRRMGKGDRLLVTGITLPWLVVYGYVPRPRSASG